MSDMIKIIYFVIILLMSNGAFADCKSNAVRQIIDNEMHRFIQGDKYAEGFASPNNYFPIKWNNGSKEGCIVYMNVGGWRESNAIEGFLVIVNLSHGKPKLQDTIELGRTLSNKYYINNYEVAPKVKNNILIIGARFYSKTDPNCCPSIPGKVKFRFDGMHFVEMKP